MSFRKSFYHGMSSRSTSAMSIDDYVFINLVALKFVGLYPLNIVRYLICIGCMILIVIPQVIQVYQERQSLAAVLEISSVLFMLVVSMLKSFIWIFNRKSLQSFIHFMLTDYWQLVNTDTSEHLTIYATYAKKITKSYMLLISNALLFFYSLPVIDIIVSVTSGTTDDSIRKHFPFVASYPLTFYTFPLYEIIYISQMLATSFCALLVLAIDTIIATALFYTCGHFKILQEKLSKLDTDIHVINNLKSNAKTTHLRIQTMKLRMARIIRHHQIVLWFCDGMERNFSLMLLLQTLASSSIICLVGLQVSTTLAERSKLVKYFSYLLMALFQILLFSFPGDILISQSTNVRDAVYSIQWYDLPFLLKTEVYLLILRGQKPSRITAGKLYVMHLEHFSTVLSTALSYFTLLRSFSSDDTDTKVDI